MPRLMASPPPLWLLSSMTHLVVTWMVKMRIKDIAAVAVVANVIIVGKMLLDLSVFAMPPLVAQ